MALNNHEISIVKGMLNRGDKQHDIAAYFGVNGGRVAEISSGQTGGAVLAAAAIELPPAGPIMAGRSALHIKATLEGLRDLINDALDEISQYERRN